MKFILATKKGMTQVFMEDGRVLAGTILSAGPVIVTQVKAKEGTDSYAAVQVGYQTQKTSRLSKPQHTKAFKVLKEFRIADATGYEVGKEITADTFSTGDSIEVAGTSKGKGFAGVVKRHGFKGGPRTHGQKHSEREAGAIGGSGGRAGGRVAKGIRMAGRMGNDRVTVKNLRVLAVDPTTNEIVISGAVPGAKGSLVEIISMPSGRQSASSSAQTLRTDK